MNAGSLKNIAGTNGLGPAQDVVVFIIAHIVCVWGGRGVWFLFIRGPESFVRAGPTQLYIAFFLELFIPPVRSI